MVAHLEDDFASAFAFAASWLTSVGPRYARGAPFSATHHPTATSPPQENRILSMRVVPPSREYCNARRRSWGSVGSLAVTDEERAAELGLTARVGAEFVRLGLQEHAARARAHYRAVRAGRVSKEWTSALTLEWARMLRLPPHERHYRVLPRMSMCPDCTTSRKLTQVVFPGGARFKCAACDGEWLELESAR